MAQQNFNVEHAMNTAIQYHSSGNLRHAEQVYRQVLESQPKHPIALHLLGVIAFQAGHYEPAEKLISQAISLKPDFDEAHNNLGNVLKNLDRLEDAIFHYEQSIRIKPDVSDVYFNMATALEALGETDKAIINYQRALEIKPRVAQVLFNMGNLYRGTGKKEKAIKYYRKTIEVNPQYAQAYRQLSSLKKFMTYDDDIITMEKLYENPKIPELQKMHLAFGLSKAFEDLRKFELSFQHLNQGNLIRRKSFDFKISNWGKYISRQINVFNTTLFNKHKTAGCIDDSPIFILGMPRSGTSLVEQILASHPDVDGAGESQAFNNTIANIFELSGFPENVIQAKTETFKSLGEDYLRKISQRTAECKFVTDKMPDNFKIIGMIKLLFPNAKIIHCCREPMDNCLSLLKTYFSSQDLVYAYDQTELGLYYNGYKKLMNHWHKVLPGFIYDIQYEELVKNQKEQTLKLLKYCNLEWDDACLNFHKTKRMVKTASASQVRQPIYIDSIKLWKNYEAYLKPLFHTLENIY